MKRLNTRSESITMHMRPTDQLKDNDCIHIAFWMCFSKKKYSSAFEKEKNSTYNQVEHEKKNDVHFLNYTIYQRKP